MRRLRIFSSGGGVQSTAALILSANEKIDFPIHVFANTGNDSEHPDTLAYVRDVLVPYAAEAGIEFVETQKRRQGKYEKQTLVEHIYRTKRSIPIPARLPSGAPGNRNCTVDFKIRVIDKWIAENDGKGQHIEVGLGITTDEIHRAKSRPIENVRGFTKQVVYPLIDMRLSRADCQNMIRQEGLPVPPKSSCFFCPFHSRDYWIRLREQRPKLFGKAVEIEEHINAKRRHFTGEDAGIRLHYSLLPLKQAVGKQMELPMMSEFDNCETGYCMT